MTVRKWPKAAPETAAFHEGAPEVDAHLGEDALKFARWELDRAEARIVRESGLEVTE